MSNWKPIETAPKDGSEVLLASEGSQEMDFYRWNAAMGEWLDRCSDPPHDAPTHWMKLDPP